MRSDEVRVGEVERSRPSVLLARVPDPSRPPANLTAGAGPGPGSSESVGRAHGIPTLLTGWGGTPGSAAVLVRPEGPGPLERVVAERDCGAPPGGRGVIPRGLGRSYGDAAQCGGGVVLDMSAFDAVGEIDLESGLVEAGGGTSIDVLLRRVVPQGWFVPVTPGTRQVTVGGAIAADVHGKNHHLDGGFCSHVARLTLATPTGPRVVGPDLDAGLFWATAGGMGLTGAVVSATVRLLPVETSWMVVDTERFGDLDSVMSAMEATDADHRYSVAWVDCSGGRGTGRSILSRGDHAPRAALGRRQEDAFALPPPPRLRVPRRAPRGLINSSTVQLFNELWFRRTPRRETGALVSMWPFFYPLDAVADWNLLYGRAGFVQYQFAVGLDRADVVRQAVAMAADVGVPSSLAVLKRFGPGDPGPLSFPMEGWTLALDFPVGPGRLPALLDRLDTLVVEAGGRVYLAKDARLSPELFTAMYPRAAELAAVRSRVDPRGVLRSDLSRRLGIDHVGPQEETARV
ncbi:MAG: FAD-binding protein [Acidimicrobiales bacterium]